MLRFASVYPRVKLQKMVYDDFCFVKNFFDLRKAIEKRLVIW